VIMQGMFLNAKSFNQDISKWNVDKVSNYASFNAQSALQNTNIPVKF